MLINYITFLIDPVDSNTPTIIPSITIDICVVVCLFRNFFITKIIVDVDKLAVPFICHSIEVVELSLFIPIKVK